MDTDTGAQAHEKLLPGKPDASPNTAATTCGVSVATSYVLLGLLILFSICGVYAYCMMIYDDAFDNMAEASYFMLITAATVGYGDMSPTSEAGKVLTVVFIVVVLGCMAIVTGFAMRTMDDLYDEDAQATLEDKRARLALGVHELIRPKHSTHCEMYRHVYIGIATLAIFEVVGMMIYFSFLNHSPKNSSTDWINSIYWATVTISSVGYGDITPDTNDTKELWVVGFFAILSTPVVAYVFSSVAVMPMKHARQSERTAFLKHMFIGDGDEADANAQTHAEHLMRLFDAEGDGKISECEFVLLMLMFAGDCNQATVEDLRVKFNLLLQHFYDEEEAEHHKFLNLEEMVALCKEAHESSPTELVTPANEKKGK